MPQSTSLTFAFSALEVVLMGRYPHVDGAERPCDVAIARAAMARTETLALAERRYPTLSGGEQARTTLARVLAQEAPLLLLDEPTAHLDPRHQHATLAVARTMRAAGATIVAVLHDLNLAAAYADRVALLNRGRLAAIGTPHAVLAPDLLAAVFGIAFEVLAHPTLAWPVLVPRPSPEGMPTDARPAAVVLAPETPLEDGQC
jgi:iron complex transport system ATP-binding protein